MDRHRQWFRERFLLFPLIGQAVQFKRATQQTISLLENYSASITDAHGCSASTSFSIGNTPGPIVSSYGTPVSCFGANDGTASVSVITGNTYQVTWSNGQTGTQLTGLAPGTYTATVSTSTGCISTSSYTVGSPSAITLSLNASSSTCGTTNGSVSANVIGGLAPYTYVWTGFPAQTSSVLSNLSAGSYSLQISDANGCTANGNASVSSQNGPSIQVVSQQDAACFGESNGSASVAVSGGVAPIAITWSNGASGTTATGLLAGNYVVTAVDAIGCTAVSTILIGQPAALLATYTSTNASCGLANGTASLTVNGGTAPYTYSWSNGSFASAITAASGNYSVQVSDAHACSVSVLASIFSAASPSVSIIGITQVSCYQGNDAAIQAYVSGGTAPYTYHWSNNAIGSALNGVPAGNYTVTITDASSCSATASVQVTEPSAWNVSSSIGSSTCGNPNGSVHLSPSGASAPYSIFWSTGATGAQLNNVPAGIYSVTISDANGCVFNNFYQVADAGGLSLNVINQTDALCAGASNGTASVQAIGGTSPYVYVWEDGSALPQNTALAAGDYVVSVTDINGCMAIANVHIQEAAPMQISLNVSDGTCGLNNAAATVSVSGGTAPYSYAWTNGALTSSVAGLVAGNIGVQVTDAHACSSSSNATVSIAAALQTSVNILQGVSCYGNADALVEIQGSSTLQAQWSNGQTGLQAIHLAAGNYSVIGIDAGACRDTVNFTISEPTALQVQLSVQDATCSQANGSASVQVSGGMLPYTYSWSNGVNTAVNSALPTGQFTVDITDANGCSLHDAAQVQSIQLLHIDSFQLSPVTCNGLSDGTAQAVVSGAVGNLSYAWSSGGNANQASGLAAGNYSLLLEDAAGCSQTASFTISAPAALQVSIQTTNVSCAGGANGTASATVNGGVAPYLYAWDGLSSNSAFTAGTHTLEVNDANGCAVASNFQINEPSALTLQLTAQTPRCGLANGSISSLVTGGTSPYSYQWNTGATSANLALVGNGDYTATVIDANGCSAQQSQVFADPGAPVLHLLAASNISCAGWSDGAISVSTTGGTGAYAYTWSNPNLTGTNITTLFAGNYSVEVQDELLCRDTLTITLSEPQALQLSLSAQAVTCAGGSNGWVNTQVSGGTAPYAYAWSNATSAAQLSQVAAGNYSLTLVDAHACSISSNIEVSEPLPLSGSITSHSVICYGEASGWAEVTVNGGVAPYTYAWSSGATDSVALDLSAGTHQVVVRDANACLLSLQTEVLQPEALHVNFTGIDKLCFGDSALLMASSTGGVQPYSYIWNAQAGDESYVWHADSTHYELLLAIDANGCRDSVKRELLVYALPQAGISFAEREMCAGECVTLTAMSVDGGVYSWSDSRQAIQNGQSVSFCYEDSGSVSMQLHVSDVHGCSSTWQQDSFIEVHPLPVVGFSPNHMSIPLLDALVYFENTSTGAVSYQWDFNPRSSGEESVVNNPYFQFTEVGDYPVTLTAINEFGCASSLERTITVTKDFAVYFPNAFTPNADGMNDRFMPSGTGIDTDQFSMQIFNRWGQLVYETNTWGQGWDGTFLSQQGGKEEAGSELFVWQMLITDFKGLMHDYRGSVMLVR